MPRSKNAAETAPIAKPKKKQALARRTQTERREGTIRSLLDAAIAVLVEQGYSGASVQAITTRAGLSQGALFRHFPTREALMVAVGEDVGRAQIEAFRSQFEAGSGAPQPAAETARVRLALCALQARCRAPENQAWYELALAARTSPVLREALAPSARRYYEAIEGLARSLLPDLASALGPRFGLVVEMMLAIFDGDSVHRFVVEEAGDDDARIELLTALLSALTPASPARADAPKRAQKASAREAAGGRIVKKRLFGRGGPG